MIESSLNLKGVDLKNYTLCLTSVNPYRLALAHMLGGTTAYKIQPSDRFWVAEG